MALISCPSCGKEVSDKALACPGCGYDLSELHKAEKPKPVVCEECGTGIPENATVCPNCGCPLSTVVKDFDTNIKAATHPDAIYCYKKGIQNLYIRCSCGCEFRYMNTLYKRTILSNGDYKFAGGLPIICPKCRAIYDTISFAPVENISTQHVNQQKIELEEGCVPHCPICGSTSLSKITNTHKASKMLMFGVFGMGENGKTWKCDNCGSKF